MTLDPARHGFPGPCFAAETAVGCESPAAWRVRTRLGFLDVCERHLRLVEVKLERAGLEPLAERPEPVREADAGSGAARPALRRARGPAAAPAAVEEEAVA